VQYEKISARIIHKPECRWKLNPSYNAQVNTSYDPKGQEAKERWNAKLSWKSIDQTLFVIKRTWNWTYSIQSWVWLTSTMVSNTTNNHQGLSEKEGLSGSTEKINFLDSVII